MCFRSGLGQVGGATRECESRTPTLLTETSVKVLHGNRMAKCRGSRGEGLQARAPRQLGEETRSEVLRTTQRR
jgi:hypothetical protein